MGGVVKEQYRKYDAIIIGVGQAGDPLAGKLIENGYHIAVVERDLEGGSCVNYGCTPSKAMISSARTAYTIRKSREWAINSTLKDLDFAAVCQRRDKIVSSFRKGITRKLEDEDKIDLYRGTGVFTGEKEIHVVTSDGDYYLSAETIYINTGTNPRIPELEGLDQVNYYHGKTWTEIRELPEKLLIVGGGYIGIEMSQMFSRFGSKVTVIESSGQILPREDEDMASEIQKILQEENIEFRLNTKLKSLRKVENNYTEAILSTENKESKLTFTHILIAAGTVAATKELRPEAAGIKTGHDGYIEVNDTLETSVKGIFALGDCKGGPEFTHISYDDYRIIIDHLFGEGKRRISDRPLPYTLFTDPELGRIGINEKTANSKNIKYRLARLDASHIARAIETNQAKGKIKVLVGEDDRLLGASVLAPEGGELMAMIQIAMMGKLKWTDLKDAIFAHPTLSESLNNLFMTVG